MIYISTPYRNDKRLGKAYNDFYTTLPDGCWGLVRDLDTLFLTPRQIAQIEKYTERWPDTGIFTCYTNRVGYLPGVYKTNQVYQDRVNDDPNILNHMNIAQQLEAFDISVTEIDNVISGMLMVIKKSTWQRAGGFREYGIMGVDNDFSQKVLDLGLKIYRMNTIYIWHSYRIWTDIRDKSHLK